MDSALTLFRKAAEIDQQFIPAHLSYMIMMRKVGRGIELRKMYGFSGNGTPFVRCLNALAWAMSGHDVPQADTRYEDLLMRDGRTPCSEIVRVRLHWTGDVRAELLAEAMRLYGSAPTLTSAFVSASRKTTTPVGDRPYREAIEKAPKAALAYKFELLRELLAAGDEKTARREGELVVRTHGSDKRPYVRWQLLEIERMLLMRENPQFSRRWHSLNAEMRNLARRNKAPALEFDAVILDAIEDVNRGDLREAVAYLRDATALAVKLKSPDFQMLAFLYRGRALAAQGRQEAAIADLLRAADAARILGERYRLAESYHHMAHAYEARANWPKAIAAADTFVRIGATVRDKSMRMIRLSDAAAIQWKAGYHARANQLYLEMVKTIDADSVNFEYAGAYFERTGDLARAAQYYHAAVENRGSGSMKLALAGLTRVFERLGSLDSAEATARKHDALVLSPEREILLPPLLARIGRRREATEQSARWVDIQLARGSPTGIAAALNQEAELLLPTRPETALGLLVRSDSFAAQVNSVAELAASRRLRGLARSQMGDIAGGTKDLIAALGLAKKVQDVFLPVTIATDIANVAARAHRPREALGWYVRASDAARSATTNFEDPVLIARFRNARREIFDGALRAIFQLPENERAAQFTEWSGRKKGNASRVQPVSSLRIPDRTRAVLDYLTVGDTIVVTVITRTAARTIMLPLSARQTAEMGKRLVAPIRETHNGSIDIQRAFYPLDLAERLYGGLLGPVASLLEGIQSLTIVPDVPLELIPFDALVVRQAKGANDYLRAVYVADKWTITFAPTVAAGLRSPEKKSFAGRSLLFVSHAAPGVDRERNAVRAAWPSPAMRHLANSRATESRVRRAAPAQIIHFATHAVSDEVDPFRSHLVLEREGGDDGLMHSKEIRERPWNSSLIFLSACETLSGPAFVGTGTLSLGRAFLDGGARMVVATQWPVGQATADISGAFYSGLARGETPAKALRGGKIRIRMNPVTAHPFFWASHILIAGSN